MLSKTFPKLIASSFLALTLSFSAFAGSISLDLYSAGLKEGGYKNGKAEILVDGIDYAKNRVGINLVVLDELTGEWLTSKSFNTSKKKNSSKISQRLVKFINRLDEGNIVLAAVRKDAVKNISIQAIDALYSLGASSFSQGINGSWALIGAAGLGQGNGQQVWDLNQQGPTTLSSSFLVKVPLPASALLFSLGLLVYTRRKTRV